jgi:hypothetical protein
MTELESQSFCQQSSVVFVLPFLEVSVVNQDIEDHALM